MLIIRVFFVCLISTACALNVSASVWRCNNAMQVGFTDAPPFDGEHVELHFVDGYNETELEETVAAYQKDGYFVTFNLCDKERKKREQTRKIEELQRNQRLKDQWNVTQLEIECARVMEAYDNATRYNREKWFWQEYKVVHEPATSCLCYRQMDNNNAFTLHVNHPCAELDCAKHDSVFGNCSGRSSEGTLYPGYVPPCINKIKIKKKSLIF